MRSYYYYDDDNDDNDNDDDDNDIIPFESKNMLCLCESNRNVDNVTFKRENKLDFLSLTRQWRGGALFWCDF